MSKSITNRLERLERKTEDSNFPDTFHYPSDGTPEEQRAFDADIASRRARTQLCYVWGVGQPYATEREAETDLLTNFL